LLAGLASLLLIVVLGGAALLLFRGGGEGGAIAEANALMGDLDNGRYDSAFNRIPQDCRTDRYADEVNDIRDGNLAGRLSGFDLELDEGASDDRDAVVTGTATVDDQLTPVLVDMQNSDGDWQVCSFEIGEAE